MTDRPCLPGILTSSDLEGRSSLVCHGGRVWVPQIGVVFEKLHPFLQEAASSVAQVIHISGAPSQVDSWNNLRSGCQTGGCSFEAQHAKVAIAYL